MNRIAVLTVVTRHYLHFARALVVSVKAVSPETPVVLCVVDRPEPPLDPRRESATILYGDELGVPQWRRFAFQYGPFELACALKPFALRRVLELGYEQVAYFDADIQLYDSLDRIARVLEPHALVLTPHLDQPLPADGQLPDDREILTSGAYNAGFLGIQAAAASDAFLRWWADKVSSDCVIDRPTHRFLDQGWLDLVPGMFGGVHVERDPGWNVGYWNLPFRQVTGSAPAGYRVNGQPLCFFHFSGFEPRRPGRVSRHDQRLRLSELPAVAELMRGYVTRLAACGLEDCSGWEYGFARLNDGTRIEPAWREAVRTGQPELAAVADPFDRTATPALVETLQAVAPRLGAMSLEKRLALLRGVEEHWALGRLLRAALRVRGWWRGGK